MPTRLVRQKSKLKRDNLGDPAYKILLAIAKHGCCTRYILTHTISADSVHCWLDRLRERSLIKVHTERKGRKRKYYELTFAGLTQLLVHPYTESFDLEKEIMENLDCIAKHYEGYSYLLFGLWDKYKKNDELEREFLTVIGGAFSFNPLDVELEESIEKPMTRRIHGKLVREMLIPTGYEPYHGSKLDRRIAYYVFENPWLDPQNASLPGEMFNIIIKDPKANDILSQIWTRKCEMERLNLRYLESQLGRLESQVKRY